MNVSYLLGPLSGSGINESGTVTKPYLGTTVQATRCKVPLAALQWQLPGAGTAYLSRPS